MPKQTRPRVFVPVRLLRRMDGIAAPVTWIAGPAGGGKTTLVRSWLDARKIPALWYTLEPTDADPATFFLYLGRAAGARRGAKPLPPFRPEYAERQALSRFARGFFEELARRLPKGAAFVLDGLEEIPEGSPLQWVLASIAGWIPQRRVIVISRGDPPKAWARLRARRELALIGWSELRFTRVELRGLVRAVRGSKRVDPEELERLDELTEGWPAGVVLLHRIGDAPSGAPVAVGPALFDYFASEIVGEMPKRIQRVVFSTSTLPEVSADAAVAASGVEASAEILEELSAQHAFTTRTSDEPPRYRYHPLLRAFLRREAPARLGARWLTGQLRLGAFLESEQRDEEAIAVYEAAGAADRALEASLRQAPVLLAQGRNDVLRERLARYAPREGERDPRACYWEGVATLALNPSAARVLFECAWEGFGDRADATGRMLAWSGIIQAIVLESTDYRKMDAWLDLIDRRCVDGLPPQLEAIVATGVFLGWMHRRPGHPEIREWARRALEATASAAPPEHLVILATQQLIYAVMAGESGWAEDVVTLLSRFMPKAPPLLESVARAATGMYWIANGDSDAADAEVERGLAVSRGSGITLWRGMLFIQGAAAALARKDSGSAARWLKKADEEAVSPNRIERSVRVFHESVAALQRGDAGRAVVLSEAAVAGAREVGFILNESFALPLLAQAYMVAGDELKAERTLEESLDLATRESIPAAVFITSVVRAAWALKGEDLVAADRWTDAAVAVARQRGVRGLVVSFADPGTVSRVFARALERGCGGDVLPPLIRALRLEPPPLAGAAWPWPLRIQSFGEFRIWREDTPLVFARKVQKKPLALLKALAAAGGTASEATLRDMLWPEAEGDASAQSLAVTVHRVRELLGDETVLRRRNGRLSLDPARCHLDSVHLIEILRELEKPAMPADRIRELASSAIAMWTRGFLADEESAWAMRAAESLRARLHLRIRAAADALRAGGDPRGGARLLEQLDLAALASPVSFEVR